MRRWFEFGNSTTNPISGVWSLQSDRGSPREHGQFPPAFVSMPHKDELFSILTALQTSVAAGVAHFWMKAGDQGVDPAADCTALHFPRNFVFPSGALQVNLAVEPWIGYPIFNSDGSPTGNFSSPIFTFNTEPPDENG